MGKTTSGTGKTGKNSFVLYDDYQQHFELLSSDDVKSLILAIFEYHKNGTPPSLSPIAGMAFSFIKSNLDRDSEKYQVIVERNRINGPKGGRPKEPSGLSGNPEKPTITQRNPEKPRKADNGNGTVIDTDAGNVIVGDTPPTPQHGGAVKKSQRRLSKTELKRVKVEKNSNIMTRIGKWFGRGKSTLWTMYESEALSQCLPVDAADIAMLEKYYTANIPDNDIRRHDLGTLLNNWNGELDRARKFTPQKTGDRKTRPISTIDKSGWDHNIGLDNISF